MSTHFRHGAAQKSRGIGSAKKAALKAAFKFIGKLTNFYLAGLTLG